jgi:asparagine synthase (glutamine-hydrolysing)
MMSGLYGWSLEPNTPVTPETETAIQHRSGPVVSAAGNQAAGVRAVGNLAKTHSSGTLNGAISGAPVWHDAEFASLAATQGHASALLAAYARFGAELPQHLGGSFALAVVDAGRRRCLLAVDRIGIEPLCYAVTPHGVIFGSTVDAVAAHPAVGRKLDRQALYDYLYFHAVPSPRTIFVGVSKLAPAERVLFENGTARTSRYWQFEFASEWTSASETELRAQFLQSLQAATDDAQAGARTGCFLSGGIDSSTVAGMLARRSPGNAHSFTISFPVSDYDEMKYAQSTIERFGLRSHVHSITPQEVADAVPQIAGAYDEPFGNSSAVPAYYCAKQARSEGFDRLLAGDGGDELFGGNVRYVTQYLFELYWRLPEGLRKSAIEPLLLGTFGSSQFLPIRKLRRYVEQAKVPLPDRLQTYNYFSLQRPERILDPALLADINREDPLEQLRSVYHAAPAHSALDRMLFLDWKFTLADNDLRKVSRTCALAGVEVRYPWLDDRVVELSTRIPPSLKVRRRTLRYFAKRALTGFLPDEVIHKPKHGFGLPFGVWLKDVPALREVALDSLQALKKRGIVQPAYIDELIHRHQHEHAHYYGEFIWVLMVLELWLRSRSL